MRVLLTLIVISSTLFVARTQGNLQTLSYQAKEAYDNGDFDSASKLYKELVDTDDYWVKVRSIIPLARCYVKINELEKAKQIIENRIESGVFGYSDLMLDPAFKPLQGLVEFNELNNDTTIYTYDIIMDLINSKDSVLIYENKSIKFDLDDSKLLQYYGEFVESEDSLNGIKRYRTYFDKSIEFHSCTFNYFELNNIGLRNIEVSNSEMLGKYPSFHFTDVQLNGLELTFNSKLESLGIHYSTIEKIRIGTESSASSIDYLYLDDNTFGTTEVNKEFEKIFSDSLMNMYDRKGLITIGNGYMQIKIMDFTFRDNKVYSKDELGDINFGLVCKNANILNNSLEGVLNLNNLTTTNHLELSNNSIDGYVSIHRTLLSEFHNEISWSQFNGQKLFVLEGVAGKDNYIYGLDCVDCHGYFGVTQKELTNDESYRRLIASYYKLYNLYKDKGDLESANACYAEMKDVTGRRLQAIYKRDGGFNNFIQWKLNRLLKVYTNHGTDTSLPIAISVNVILAFSIFYFFFPSDWDVSSKSKLIKNFRTFMVKNEHGYVKPFLILLAGFGVSLINALTLSVNAFVTLGFGAIPTRGLARYVCIIQGFIGWFLLSIFTVTLINQVLF